MRNTCVINRVDFPMKKNNFLIVNGNTRNIHFLVVVKINILIL